MHKFYCGAAKEEITPSAKLLPRLTGLLNQSFGGVLDPLFLRVIALENQGEKALLIAFDLDKAPYPKEQTAKLSASFGIPEENIFYFSTHTHTAPLTDKRPYDGPNSMEGKPADLLEATGVFEGQIEQALLRAAARALESLQPARLGIGKGQSYINVNRNQRYSVYDEAGHTQEEVALGVNPEAFVSREVDILRFETLAGEPIAFFLNYPVHCCVLHMCACMEEKLPVSGDIAGGVSHRMEARYPSTVALWSSGAAGDVNPVMMNELYHPDPHTGAMVISRVGMGAQAMLETLVARHWADVRRIAEDIVCDIEEAPIRACARWAEIPARDDEKYTVRLHVLRLGEVLLCGFSGELYTSYGEALKQLSPSPHTLLINHDGCLGARSGYIIDDETLRRDTSGNLPGMRHNRIPEGQLRAALEAAFLDACEATGA